MFIILHSFYLAVLALFPCIIINYAYVGYWNCRFLIFSLVVEFDFTIYHNNHCHSLVMMWLLWILWTFCLPLLIWYSVVFLAFSVSWSFLFIGFLYSWYCNLNFSSGSWLHFFSSLAMSRPGVGKSSASSTWQVVECVYGGMRVSPSYEDSVLPSNKDHNEKGGLADLIMFTWLVGSGLNGNWSLHFSELYSSGQWMNPFVTSFKI